MVSPNRMRSAPSRMADFRLPSVSFEPPRGEKMVSLELQHYEVRLRQSRHLRYRLLRTVLGNKGSLLESDRDLVRVVARE